MRELIIDGFAGGGGASTGIHMALGRSPDIAINHDAVAVAMHTANHPDTEHYCQNIWKAVPSEVVKGRRVGLAWFSPDCKHFSKAKGGKPVKKNIRDLAWVVVAWARLPRRLRPRVIAVENVEEFVTWGPLGVDGRPCIERGGQTFRKWVRALQRLGYRVDWRELVAADFGSPTIRKRLFVIARLDKMPIVWPEHSHGKPDLLPVRAGKLKPWRTAAYDVIDWSIPCPSIFDTAEEIMARYGVRAIRPLADNTHARLAKGVERYVLEAAEPFIVPVSHSGDTRVHPIGDPLRTTTASSRANHALAMPFMTKFHEGSTGQPIVLPFPTVSANSFLKRPGGAVPLAVVAAYLAQHNTDMVGHDAREPMSTIVQKGCTQAVVSAGLVNLKGSDRRGGSVERPAPTQTAGGQHIAHSQAFLMKYYGADQDPQIGEPLHTATSKDRFGLVEVPFACQPLTAAQIARARQVADFLRAHGVWDDREFVTIGPWLMTDLGMRMFTPRELFRAQGFPDSYIIERTADGAPITKTDQIRMCGNSVCPQVAAAIVAANYSDTSTEERDDIPFVLAAAE